MREGVTGVKPAPQWGRWAQARLEAGESGGEGGLVGGFEEGGAGHKGVGTGGAAFGAVGEVDTTIHFEAKGERAFAAPGGELGQLRQHVAAEGLATEAGLDSHHEDEVDVGEEGFNGADRRAGVEHEAILATEGADAGEGGRVIVSGLDVNADEVGAGLGEGIDVVLRLGQHEMGVEEEFRARAAEGGEGLGAEGEVGDEVSVHDIAVQPGQT